MIRFSSRKPLSASGSVITTLGTRTTAAPESSDIQTSNNERSNPGLMKELIRSSGPRVEPGKCLTTWRMPRARIWMGFGRPVEPDVKRRWVRWASEHPVRTDIRLSADTLIVFSNALSTGMTSKPGNLSFGLALAMAKRELTSRSMLVTRSEGTDGSMGTQLPPARRTATCATTC